MRKIVFLLFACFFLSRHTFSQSDTIRVNDLTALAWKLRLSNLDTSILLNSQALDILDHSFKNKHFQNNWVEKTYIKTYYALGVVYNNRGDIVKPPDYFTKALQIANLIHYDYGQALSNAGFGLYFLQQSKFSEALNHFYKALQIDERIGNKAGIAADIANVGNVYASQHMYEKASECYGKALQLGRELKDDKRVATQLGNIGNVFFDQRNFSKAADYYSQALDLSLKIDSKYNIGMNLNNLAAVYQLEKKYNKSLDYYTKALQLANELDDKDNIGTITGNIGILYFLMKDYPMSEIYLTRAIKIANELKSIEAIKEFEGALSDLYAALGRDKEALEHFKKHQVAQDSIFNAKATEKSVRLEMNYEFDKKQAVSKAEHEKEIIAFEAENKIQKQLHLFLLVVIGLILIILFFVKRAYDNKKRVAGFLASESQRKEVLLQEVHHRINNNLQIISSLLSLQANSARDERLHEYLHQSQNRIQSLSALHELLYQTDSPLEINMEEYLNKVLDFQRDVLNTKSLNITIKTNISPVTFPTKKAVPLALIVNELVTNSIKYAFDEKAKGSINISLVPGQEKDAWILSFSDTGKGLPAETEMRKDSLGLRLVNIMTKQMGGSFTKTNTPGASFTFLFSLIS